MESVTSRPPFELHLARIPHFGQCTDAPRALRQPRVCADLSMGRQRRRALRSLAPSPMSPSALAHIFLNEINIVLTAAMRAVNVIILRFWTVCFSKATRSRISLREGAAGGSSQMMRSGLPAVHLCRVTRRGSSSEPLSTCCIPLVIGHHELEQLSHFIRRRGDRKRKIHPVL